MKNQSNQVQQAFEAMLEQVCARPAMYVGYDSLRALSHLLGGYCHALEDIGTEVYPLKGWQRWVELQYLIFAPDWHWTRILVHEYGTDRKALDALPELYSRFVKERAEKGVDGIEAELKQELATHRGEFGYRPKKTRTSDKWFVDPPVGRQPN